jgi:hypothetical protein
MEDTENTKIKRFNHMMDLGFEVLSDSEDEPSEEEVLTGLIRRVAMLIESRAELKEACAIVDTMDHEVIKGLEFKSVYPAYSHELAQAIVTHYSHSYSSLDRIP